MTKKTQPVQPKRRGPKPILTTEHTAVLRAIVRKHPHSSLDGLTHELRRRTGIKVNTVTMHKALRAAAIVRLKPQRRMGERAATRGAAARYGYTARHRRPDNPNGMNTDVTDEEWALARGLFNRKARRGTPEKYSRREMFNACSCVVRTGCAWRLLPRTFPPWPVVHKTFSRWAAAGLLETMHVKLHKPWRDHGDKAAPGMAIIGAQSTRASAQGGDNGFDAGKKVKGRKRHLVVDSMGLVLAVTVTAASVQDCHAAPQVVAQAHAKAPTIKRLYADCAYAGKCAWPSGRSMAPSLKSCAIRATALRAHGTTRRLKCRNRSRKKPWSRRSSPRPSPQVLCCRSSAGWSSAPTPGMNAHAV